MANLMIQGTMSNAGKSILTAALCRIFKQDGYSVAPFKSQNMALNSYITRDNLEMGRAQVVQARACKIEPEVTMNPILLKPTTDVGSQVIIKGRVVGNMSAAEYFDKKKSYIPTIMEAYRELEDKYDIIVIEGAGSPAEINLRKDDIVNMGLAELVDAPVLLVGDIDRGGVFAQLYGTVELLTMSEKERIKGFIINKFRGDKKLLLPGLDMLYEKTGKKTLGVVPYMNIDIEDEDSLTERFLKEEKGIIDIAVIKLPRISNFTDFQALSMDERLTVRYVSEKSKLGNPDVIILPGTKNTISDMKWLTESGFAAIICKSHAKGTMVVGICGGYQMLGDTIKDEPGVEGARDSVINGLGLISMNTVFTTEKNRRRVEGRILPIEAPDLKKLSGCKVSGYEIHMGISQGNEDKCLVELTDLSGNAFTDGRVGENVFGTYVHGIFDEDEFRNAFIRMLFDIKGIEYGKEDTASYEEYQEKQFDELARIVRENVDIAGIYEIMGL